MCTAPYFLYSPASSGILPLLPSVTSKIRIYMRNFLFPQLRKSFVAYFTLNGPQSPRAECAICLSGSVTCSTGSPVVSVSLYDIGCMLAMADPVAAARNFLNALERIPSIIDQYKAKNEVQEKEVSQLQEIAGKVWKKEDELKQLKSELAALDRKIQLELEPPTPEVAEKENDGQEVKPDAEGVRNVSPQHTEDVPQIRSSVNERSPSGNFIADHIIIGRPGFNVRDECKPKGIKM